MTNCLEQVERCIEIVFDHSSEPPLLAATSLGTAAEDILPASLVTGLLLDAEAEFICTARATNK